MLGSDDLIYWVDPLYAPAIILIQVSKSEKFKQQVYKWEWNLMMIDGLAGMIRHWTYVLHRPTSGLLKHIWTALVPTVLQQCCQLFALRYIRHHKFHLFSNCCVVVPGILLRGRGWVRNNLSFQHEIASSLLVMSNCIMLSHIITQYGTGQSTQELRETNNIVRFVFTFRNSLICILINRPRSLAHIVIWKAYYWNINCISL